MRLLWPQWLVKLWLRGSAGRQRWCSWQLHCSAANFFMCGWCCLWCDFSLLFTLVDKKHHFRGLTGGAHGPVERWKLEEALRLEDLGRFPRRFSLWSLTSPAGNNFSPLIELLMFHLWMQNFLRSRTLLSLLPFLQDTTVKPFADHVWWHAKASAKCLSYVFCESIPIHRCPCYCVSSIYLMERNGCSAFTCSFLHMPPLQ